MSKILNEIIDIIEKNSLTLQDYKRFRELGRKVDGADLVEYSSLSQSDALYLKNSGLLGDILNVSEVTPDILYSPL